MAVPAIIAGGAASLFGFIWRKVIFLSVFTLFWQSLLAIGLVIFVGPDFYINLLNNMLQELGFQPITCSTFPPEFCALLNIAGIDDIYKRIVGMLVILLLLNFLLFSIRAMLKAFAIWLRF